MLVADDRAFMEAALGEAEAAALRGEVPVGAVLVADGGIVALASNRCIERSDPTAHAEMEALREGGSRLANYRLDGATLYATLEPCVMCYGAAVHARLARLVYAADDPKAGALSSGALRHAGVFNHRVELVSGVEAERASALLAGFFRDRRHARRPPGSHGNRHGRGTEVVVTGPTRNRIGG